MSNYESATPPPGTMEIEVNGARRQVPKSATLAEILVFLGLPADRVAVELNRKIIRKTEWESCRVEQGAELEVVHFVGGGSDVSLLQSTPSGSIPRPDYPEFLYPGCIHLKTKGKVQKWY